MKRSVGLYLIVGILIILSFILSVVFLNLYVDWLFFEEVGYLNIFKKVLLVKLLCAIAFGLFFGIFYFANILHANSKRFPIRNLHIFGDTIYPTKTFSADRPVRIVSILGGLFLLILISIIGVSTWEQILIFFNKLDTRLNDPIFGRDIGFYLFTLPVMEIILRFSVLTLVITLIACVLNYFLRGGIAVSERGVSLYPEVRRHLAVLGAIALLMLAFNFYLDTYKLLYTEGGVIYGAGYTDVNARLYTYWLLVIITGIGAIVLPFSIFRGSYKLPVIWGILIVLIYAAGIMLYAPFLQKFKVAPNELELERKYIQHNIRFTRYGYDLDRIEVKQFDVSYELTASDIVANDLTIKNIRLWDNEPLLRTYSQLQQIRTYYRFIDIDNDRYTINGEYRQVMLAPRELSYADLPNKSWINERLVFTHGIGLAMGPVSRITKEGLPEFIISDIPPVSRSDLKITRPEIYYGEIPNDYVIVRTKVKEFNYPTSEGNVYSRYEGSGGVSISSLMRRSIFALKFNTAKILLSSDITEESRIIYYRNIKERISKIAPFLFLDPDPYMVVTEDGRLVWIIDCYTISNRVPYSTPAVRGMNYIRNSVKAVVDAYDGSVDFYISDPQDILIRVYARAFPDLFKDLSEMPDDLKGHIRYPQGLLEIQARMFASYHMTDPGVFYNREDLWEIPSYSDKPMRPYSMIMRLPGEEKEEYILLIPYTPAKRDNLAAWLAARCDMPNYGKLIVYVFPRDRLVFGPRQVNARIDQDAYISQQITLWGQVGSQVIRGSLLIIPVENSLLYVQPLYLSASDRVGLPELRRVIVAYEKKVVMEENLEKALQRLFYEYEGVEKELTPERISESIKKEDLIREALRLYELAIKSQREGRWGDYGRYIDELGKILRQIVQGGSK